MNDPKRDCACDECKALCRKTPGWFLPGEAERAAALLGMEMKEFFRRHLVVDYWVGDGDPRALAPTKRFDPVLGAGHRYIAGDVVSFAYPFIPGTCVFLDEEEHCSIHAAKPHECRMAYGCRSDPDMREAHKRVVRAWNRSEHQNQIDALLEATRR